MSDPDDYTIGWICATSTEYVTALAFLEKTHEGPKSVSPNDNNAYTLGKMGEHNIVIAVLPDGECGLSSTANVARDMMHSFNNLRLGLLVGIGGGVPSKRHDIRLGDIVVSIPRDGKGGVFHYDFGASIQDQAFRATGFLNQPPALLRAAVTKTRGQYEIEGHRIQEDIEGILQKRPRLQKTYRRPDPSSDVLYQPKVVHPKDDNSGCSRTCGDIIERPERTQDEDNPAVHYGIIASGDRPMRDALARDRLAAEEDILCFETEAAGLMNHFPCLVIRGISDYADSHATRQWQCYAAMSAAAYAKDLLRQISPSRVETEKKISDILPALHQVAQEHQTVLREQLQAERERKCHQLFRFTSYNNITYEGYKDLVEDRFEDTCLWFLNNECFQRWLSQISGPLILTADPGCGKSVLAKYLIDHALPQSATICYFFCKDGDQNTVRQVLCAILHQLFAQQPILLQHAMSLYDVEGAALIDSTKSLWGILQNAIEDPAAGSTIIVLDAIDECARPELEELIRNLDDQFCNQLKQSKLRYLLTCRPYEWVMSQFKGRDIFLNLHIDGKDESDSISQEVNLVIAQRVNHLSVKKNLKPAIKDYLQKALQETTHHTYLWVNPMFDWLEKEDFKKTRQGVRTTIATLPATINEAYENILNKSKNDPMVRKALSIILAATRPLTITEINIALNIDDESPLWREPRSIDDLDIEDNDSFQERLRSMCGLFISIHDEKVYFLHQTAREFLRAKSEFFLYTEQIPRWQHSISLKKAHSILANICMRYLISFDYDESSSTDEDEGTEHLVNIDLFLNYSVKNWDTHLEEAGYSAENWGLNLNRLMGYREQDHFEAAMIHLTLKLCNPESKSFSKWFKIYREATNEVSTERFINLLIASLYGHYAIVKNLLQNGASIEEKDNEFKRTPLAWASIGGHEAVVALLLENGADIESRDEGYQSPLYCAAEHGCVAVVRLLLDTGAKIEAQDSIGLTPLANACGMGREDVARLLLERGADIEVRDNGLSQSPLSLAAWFWREDVVRLLLEKGANPEVDWGEKKEHIGIVMMLKQASNARERGAPI